MALAGVTVTGQAATPEKLSFNQHIRPILSDKCFSCHGFDAKKRKAKLRLDIPDGAYKEEDGVQAIKPGDLAKSEAWNRILSDDPDEVMPPPDSHKTLTPEEKELIKRWILDGAPYQKHWAFESPVKTEPPSLHKQGTVRNEIDAFIQARLQKEGLKPAPEAEKEILARRVSFALTGLPPSAQELETFLTDPAPDAYEKLVDHYLASPRFGEEMARHWLDVARYGDTHGLHLDNERQMWAYRDWVIKAFNDNKPFDQFTIEQLAGDLLPKPTQEQLVATGFNRCNVTTSEGGAINEEFLFRYAVDRASTTAQAWMGLTAGCAVCHDHKYDPITAKDFYSLYAFFYSNADPAMDGNAMLTKPVLKLTTPEQQTKLDEMGTQVAALDKSIEEKLQAVKYTDPATVQPPLPVTEKQAVWVDDDFPQGAKVVSNAGNHPPTWVSAADGPVFSGTRALKRSGTELAQDYYEGGAAPLDVPVGARFFVSVFLDPADPPEEIMIQFNNGGWKHRAVWGNPDLIPYGIPNTTERFVAGRLPDTSQWVRLEVDAEKIGLKPGDKVTGIAFTVHGGTAYFDDLGVLGRNDPAADPKQSYIAWQKQNAGKDAQGVPADISKLLKEGPQKNRKSEQEKKLRDYYLSQVCALTRPEFEGLVQQQAALKKQRDDFDAAIPSTFIWNDLDKPRDAFVMIRGQYDKPGEKVEPATPAVLPALQKANPNGRASRLDLAKWLVSKENPLTARVTVNRFWQQIFGVGLVKSSYDFGSQGEMPSHPELLDWLACWYRDGGTYGDHPWNTKQLIRLMVTSAAFRQSSAVAPYLWNRDPQNRLLARGPRFRLDAEQIRDNALFVSGLLNPEMGGKGVRTYQPPNIWEPVGFVGSNTRDYKQDKGSALYRRSIYTFFKRTAPPPFMTNFDAPSRESFCTLRERSDTPLQALQLMNDVQHFEAARALAERMISGGGATPAERIAYGYRVVLARQPAPEELTVVDEMLNKQLAMYAADPEAAKKAIRNGESQPNPNMPERELAAYTMVANLLLNLDETVTRN